MEISEIIRAAWNHKKLHGLDFMEQKLYWAMRSICFLYAAGELSQEAAAQAKTELVEAYEKARPDWVRWSRSQAAYKLMMTSTNAEVRRIAREAEDMFHT